jgi:uncharacterized protein (TIGR04255 family)
MTRSSLPFFDKPPLVETVLSAQFEPVPGFTNGHLGAFWSHIGGRTSWPNIADAPPLSPEFERFGDERTWMRFDAVKMGLSQISQDRIQLQNESKDRMLQLQNGRLVYNWLGSSGGEYARYETIRPEFDKILDQFISFLRLEELRSIQPNQWEITYINHLPKDTVWRNVADWSKVFTFHAVPPPEVNACALESFNGNWIYEIAPRRGRLRVQLHHAWTAPNETEILVFNLTARGPIGEGKEGVDTIDAGLDLGHDVIVKTFAELTSPEARQFWEQKS